MVDRVREVTVTWQHRETGDQSTIRYFQGASDQYRERADFFATSKLTDADVAALEAYNRACQDGAAKFISRTTEVVE